MQAGMELSSMTNQLMQEVVLLEEEANIWGSMMEEIIHHMLTQNTNQFQISIIESLERLMACILKSPLEANIELNNSVENLQRNIFEMNSLCVAMAENTSSGFIADNFS